MDLRERLHRWLPTREYLARHPWLAWLGPALLHPKLWHWSRRGVALGVAIGMFFGLLIPLAQIPVSATVAVLLRANVPAAAAATFVTNPLTFGPIYYGAYRLGLWVTDGQQAVPAKPGPSQDATPEGGTWERIVALGKPLLTGLVIAATLTGLLTYALVTLVWRWRVVTKARRRNRTRIS